MRLNEVYAAFKDTVDFYCVYIREAHPDDGWQVPMNVDDGIVYTDPTTIQERAGLAQVCMLRLNLQMPTLVDTMDDAVDTAYAALPERLYVVDRDGTVVFKCEPGPFGFDVDAWEAAIREQSTGA